MSTKDPLGGRRPEPPRDWRDLFDPGYDYPDDLLEEAKATSGRRGARQAKKAWRKADADARKQWRRDQLTELRREDERSGSSTPLIVVLVILAAVFAAGVAKTFLGDDEGTQRPAPTASTEPSEPPTTGVSEPTAPVPSVTRSETGTGESAVPDAIREWVRVFYTRDPAGTGETYDQLVSRAGAWMTPDLVRNLSHFSDPTYEQLTKERGSSSVEDVEITKPTEGSVPTDTPIRAFRVAIVDLAVDYPEREDETFQIRLLLEMIPGEDGWVVATISGDGHEHAGE